jgi:hypothetical protein
MSETPILELSELATSQSQREVLVNEGFRWLEFFAAGSVISRALSTPPGSPADGHAYIPAPTATGAWAGHEDEIALRMGTAWAFRAAPVGFRVWVEAEEVDVRWLGGSELWTVVS